jgi:hypothetical protein
MPTQRPGSVTTAAVLAIIYGSLVILCSVCGLASVAMQGANQNLFGGGDAQQAQLQKQIEETLQRDVPLYRAVQIVAPVVGLVFGVAMLVAGFGLLGVYSWARFLAVGTAILAMLFNVVQTLYQVIFMIPGMNRVFSDVLPNAMAKAGPPPPGVMQIVQASLVAGAVIGVVIQLGVIVYLLIIVFLLFGRTARAAFAGIVPEIAIQLPEGEEQDEGWGTSAPPKNP